MGEKTNAYMYMVEEPMCRWEVKMNTEAEDTAWPNSSGLGYGQSLALVNKVMNLQVPYNAVNFLTEDPLDFSKMNLGL
jgi:hypothetical protein